MNTIQSNDGRFSLNQNRNKAVFYISVIIIGLMLLGSTLSQIEFKPGGAVPGASSTQPILLSIVEDIQSDSQSGSNSLLAGFLIIGLVLLLVSAAYGLVKNKFGKVILKALLFLGVTVILVLVLGMLSITLPESSQGESLETGQVPTFSYDVSPIGNPPEGLFRLIKFIIIVVGIIVIFGLAFLKLRQPRLSNSIADEVSTAILDIEKGDDFRNVIIRCYLQLMEITKEEQGIEREDFITPSEFEAILTSHGVPNSPIHQLTHLFEKVRYGNKATSQNDEKIAIESLTAIQKYCQPLKQVK